MSHLSLHRAGVGLGGRGRAAQVLPASPPESPNGCVKSGLLMPALSYSRFLPAFFFFPSVLGLQSQGFVPQEVLAGIVASGGPRLTQLSPTPQT